MTIIVPPDVESSIRDAVRSGRFASVDDAMTKAARLLLQQLDQGPAPPGEQAAAIDSQSAPAQQPIWEVADDIRKSIPAEEWAKLPADGAAQLDHYLYGSPKRTDR